jgi:hypothetical protein
MGNDESRMPHRSDFWVGVLVGLVIVTPVFAATTTWQPQDWPSYLLYTSLAMAGLGVLLRVLMRRSATRRVPPMRQREPDEPCYSLDAYRVN